MAHQWDHISAPISMLSLLLLTFAAVMRLLDVVAGRRSNKGGRRRPFRWQWSHGAGRRPLAAYEVVNATIMQQDNVCLLAKIDCFGYQLGGTVVVDHPSAQSSNASDESRPSVGFRSLSTAAPSYCGQHRVGHKREGLAGRAFCHCDLWIRRPTGRNRAAASTSTSSREPVGSRHRCCAGNSAPGWRHSGEEVGVAWCTRPRSHRQPQGSAKLMPLGSAQAEIFFHGLHNSLQDFQLLVIVSFGAVNGRDILFCRVFRCGEDATE